jgi:hypothetical protein
VDTEVAERSIFAPKELFLIFADELAINSCWFGEAGQGNHFTSDLCRENLDKSFELWVDSLGQLEGS